MKGAENILHAHGIRLRTYRPGQSDPTCPKCSAKRSKAHQRTKCLGVKIEANGRVIWHCNHYDWSGPKKRERSDREILPTLLAPERHDLTRLGATQ